MIAQRPRESKLEHLQLPATRTQEDLNIMFLLQASVLPAGHDVQIWMQSAGAVEVVCEKRSSGKGKSQDAILAGARGYKKDREPIPAFLFINYL